ncbi:MAG TPA: single-stranded DNA-binding protein, partial [Gemmatimonadaceae bacterium]|nr:single-stranded DNA-binding protein [Gemmatimonadaceae bacterium]
NVRELVMLSGGRGPSSDFEGESSGRSRAPAAAGAKSAAGTTAGGTDFQDFPGALEETDDDLPF